MANEPINVTDAAFERAVLQANVPVVAAFWARGAAHEEPLRRVLGATAAHYAGAVRVARVEVGDAPQTQVRYAVDTLPQFLFFRDGQLVSRARGLPSEEALRPWVEHLLGRGPAPAARQPAPSESAHPVVVTDATFDQVVLRAGVPVLVDFWAAWCGPCRAVAPALEHLAAEFAGRALIAKLDVDANQHTAMRYGVQSIPTLILFHRGEEEDRVLGAQSEAFLRDRLLVLLDALRC